MGKLSLSNKVHIDIERHDEVCLLRCKGRLVAGIDSDYLQGKIDQLKKMSCTRVIADFREVPDVGSLGISFLVGVYTSIVNMGRPFVLVGACPRVRQVLDLTRLSSVIPLASELTVSQG